MKSIVDSITQALSGIAGLLTIDGMFAVGLVMSLAMTIVFVAECFSWQLALAPRVGFVKVTRRWNTKAITIMATTTALSVILQTIGSVIVLVPGTLTFRADAMIRFPFGAIFGMPAVWGVMIANVIGDVLSGTLGPGSVAGFVISWYMAYLFYRFYHGYEDYSMLRARAWVKYYLTVGLWCLIGALYLCTNFQLLGLLPAQVIWAAVFPGVMITTFVGGLPGPVVARVVGPAARRFGLSADELGYEQPRPTVPAPVLWQEPIS